MRKRSANRASAVNAAGSLPAFEVTISGRVACASTRAAAAIALASGAAGPPGRSRDGDGCSGRDRAPR